MGSGSRTRRRSSSSPEDRKDRNANTSKKILERSERERDPDREKYSAKLERGSDRHRDRLPERSDRSRLPERSERGDRDKQKYSEKSEGDRDRLPTRTDKDRDRQKYSEKSEGDRDNGRQRSSDRDADRERPWDRNKDRERPWDRNKDREGPWDRNNDRERPWDRNDDRGRHPEKFVDRGADQERFTGKSERDRDSDRPRLAEKPTRDDRQRFSGRSESDHQRDNSRHKNSEGRGRERSQSQKTASEKDKKLKKGKDKKRKKKRSSSSSSSSSASSDSSSGSSVDSLKLLEKLEEERKKQLAETKRRKELVKAIETPEEKRARRLLKKEAKERKRKEARGWDKEYLHYTNVDNPFGDPSLLESFHWKKKLEKQGLNDITQNDLERINRAKQEENKRELEKVKKRRQERELERQRRDEEETLLQRQKEAAQFKEWGNQEDLFHLEQATLRSKIRIKDGRAKPIDLLAQYISAEQEVDAIEMHEPYTYLNGLTISDLEDLIEDIKVYKELEQGKNLSYWNDITVIVEDELRKLRKLEQDDDYRIALERREGINPSVAKDVAAVFKGKTAEQLQALKYQIQSKLDGSSSGVDISYWESLLSQLKAHIARAQLRDRHQDNLKKKLAMLKAEQGVELDLDSGEVIKIEDSSPVAGPSSSGVDKVEEMDETSQHTVASEKVATEPSADEEEEESDIIDESLSRYASGGYSPRLIGQDDIEPGIFVIGEEEDNARLDLARAQVLHVGKKVENVWTAEEKALQNEAKKGMTNDEATFSVESPLDQLYLWSDKYRPRKPRYFNRVHTGFEWNKYNQTHYDMDNPPPKIVQGYKFNIFYPDLIDKNSTPQYFLTSCADNQDFAILRFHAGPPYEDIAFKIVNREWEYSYKRGFRCQFHNNIFQLWFHFKRYRYRR